MSFTFGTPKPAAPATGGFSFGTTASPAAGTLSFGASPSTAPVASVAPATGTSFSFGSNTAAATPPTLGGTAAAATGFGFKPAGGSTFSTPAAQSSAPPLFGSTAAPTSTTSAQPLGMFGNLTGTTPSLGGSLGLAAAPSAAPAPAAPAPVVGLGGVDINANQPKTVEGKHDGTKAREAMLPQEIAATIETLKAHIKQQKTISSDIARTSQRRLNYVATETQNVKSTLAELADAVETNCASIKALRAETGQVIHHAEMAQRTHETPPGLQFENTAPLMYFAELVHKFENDLIAFKNQVELTEKHMRSLANPQSFTAQDLKHGLQQIHECFIALAGRHHEIHQKVEAQKGVYLKLRKFFLNDRTDVFAEQEKRNEAAASGGSGSGGVGVGPTPFSNLLLALPSSPPNQSQQVAPTHPMGMTSTGGAFGSAAAPSFSFGNQAATTTTGGGAFDLQKPPLGKRNKAFF